MKLILIFFISYFSILANNDPLFNILENEIKSTTTNLSKETVKPYYISYQVSNLMKYSCSSSFGLIKSSGTNLSRILDIDMRVGDYKFDNTHIIRGNPFNFSGGLGSVSLPLDNNELAIKKTIWYASDKYFKSAIERYEKALTNSKIKVTEDDKSDDFSKEDKVIDICEVFPFEVDTIKWENFCKGLSARFKKYTFIYDADVSFQAESNLKYFINSEGSKIRHQETYCRIFVYAKTKAEDGMNLPLFLSYFSYLPENITDSITIANDIDSLITKLDKLRNAPTLSTTSVPAILSGEAAGVFFHEIFGHRVEGHREKDPNSSQTFKNSLGKKILPDFIDVIFDPTIKSIERSEISGSYIYNDEGVKSKKVISVDKGIFNSFLMARNPIESFPNSNGHGRKQAGYKAVSRQSNLIVVSRNQLTEEKLKDLLREECLKQNKDFGLYFETVQGGFTYTGRTVPNAFNVLPLVVYKIYTDNSKPDELIRGVDLIGTPLTTFNNILATGNKFGIFNGVCGAESGGVPVSACSPSFLVSNIEVQKKKKSQAKLPILKHP